MQYEPTSPAILNAVASFLMEHVAPTIEEPALAYRLRIAAHLAQVVARELERTDLAEAGELERLRALLQAEGEEPLTCGERRSAIKELNEMLAHNLRAGVEAERIGDVLRHLKKTLQDQVQVLDPRFDMRLDIED